MDYGFNIFIRFGFGFGLEIDNGSGWFSNLYYLTDSELDLDSVLPSGRVGLWIQYIYRIWIWVWIQYYSQVGLDYGFNIFIGFGFGFGFINPLKSESESVNPNPTTTSGSREVVQYSTGILYTVQLLQNMYCSALSGSTLVLPCNAKH